MEKLLEFGINEKNLKNMIETNKEILELRDEEIEELVNILKEIDCSNNIIQNILTANPMFLSRNKNDVIKLIKKLKRIGLDSLNIIFDTNPWLLNKDDFEIEEFIKEKRNEGMEVNQIIDLIDLGLID